MIHANAILHGDQNKFLAHHESEHPLTLQLGGNKPSYLSKCAKIAESLGYNEVNLNVGCPSDRVQSGAFGLCMMKTPTLVAECVHEMKQSTRIPISVKCRIGYDNNDSYQELYYFIKTLLAVDTDFICIHARKGWLKGLSPKENRTIPKINYDFVYQIKKDFPNANIGINGEIQTLEEARQHLKYVDSAMIGRAAYHNPYMLINADHLIYNTDIKIKSRFDVINEMLPYIELELSKGTQLNHITRHILGLFQGVDGARLFRRSLSENSSKKGANINTLQKAISYIKV
jgi:tRNA-dihydrouridine synthase A